MMIEGMHKGHPRAVNPLPLGGTALLTPPTAVTCGPSDLTVHVLTVYYVLIGTLTKDTSRFGLHSSSLTAHIGFISSNNSVFYSPPSVRLRVSRPVGY